MENPIPISFLNDFIFCPRSIYYHQIYGNYNKQSYHQKPQIKGLAAHASIDEKTYSTQKNILMSCEVYSNEYNIYGKIDLFDIDKKILTERKREIKTIYDGYIFQLYAQYFCLTEMDYEVNQIRLYDLTHNKSYPLNLPINDEIMHQKFKELLEQIQAFNINDIFFEQNINKCLQCIYNPLCDYYEK